MSTYPVITFLFAGSETLQFSRQQVTKAILTEEISTISTLIPISAFEFEIYSADDAFSMFAGSSYTMLTERLPMTLHEVVDGITLLLGKFYLSTWKNTSERKMGFSAFDLVGILEDTDFDGVFWETPVTLQAALDQILLPINISYTLGGAFVGVEIQGWIAPGTYRSALQQICFAANATVVTARREDLLITPIVLPALFYETRIRSRDKINKATVELLPLVSTIELVSHNYSESTGIETIYSEYLAVGSYRIVFPKPYFSVVIDGPGYSPNLLLTEYSDFITTEYSDFIEAGGEYVQTSNSVYLTVTTAGQVTITGYPWIDSQRSFTFTETGVAEAQNKNTLTVSDATLIHVGNAQGVLDKLRDYNRQRYVQNIKLLPADLQVNDIILSDSLYDNVILGSIQRMNTSLTSGFLLEMKIKGIVPAYIPAATSPVRRARTGIAISAAGLTRNNSWRQYA